MSSSAREMLAKANAAVPRLNPAEVRDMIGKGNVLIIDVRDAPELAVAGKLRGAVNVSHGMLEFRAGPEPVSRSGFSEGQDCRDLLRVGGRAALSGKTLKDLGYRSVYNAGDFKELADAGLETEPA